MRLGGDLVQRGFGHKELEDIALAFSLGAWNIADWRLWEICKKDRSISGCNRATRMFFELDPSSCRNQH